MLARVGVDHIPVCAQAQGTNPWDNFCLDYRFNSYMKLVTGYETEVRQKKMRLMVLPETPLYFLSKKAVYIRWIFHLTWWFKVSLLVFCFTAHSVPQNRSICCRKIGRLTNQGRIDFGRKRWGSNRRTFLTVASRNGRKLFKTSIRVAGVRAETSRPHHGNSIGPCPESVQVTADISIASSDLHV
jgi:hypothetical protein